MAFRVGERVVCVDFTPTTFHMEGKPHLTVGGVYVVSRGNFISPYNGNTCIYVEGIDWPRGYRIERFRPLIERKTDTGMAILRKLLDGNKIEEKV